MKNALGLFVGLIAILMMVACQPDYTGALIGGNPNPVTPPGDTFTWDISARLAKHSRGAAEDHDNWKEVERVSYANGTISIVANVDGLESYTSSNTAQGEGLWIGILVGTGETDITKVSYEGTPLTPNDVNDRDDMKGSDGSDAADDEFVIWYKAEELLKNGASFTLSHAGASDFTVNVVLEDGYNVLNSEEELALLNGGKGKYQLGTDITVADQIDIIDKVTLDLNGYTLSNTKTIWNNADGFKKWSIISVQGRGDLTITGNGKIKALENDIYAVDVRDEEAHLVIESGEFIGNIHSVYVSEGSAEIKGGRYSVQQVYSEAHPYDFVLNLYDANGKSGIATIEVTGGTFEKFDPANSKSENPERNFVAEGYKSTYNAADETYIVTKI